MRRMMGNAADMYIVPERMSYTRSSGKSGEWEVEGHGCKRGRDYAIQEAACPLRVLPLLYGWMAGLLDWYRPGPIEHSKGQNY